MPADDASLTELVVYHGRSMTFPTEPLRGDGHPPKTARGMCIDTIQFGASTTSLKWRSPAILQMM